MITAMPIFGQLHFQSEGHVFSRPADFPFCTLSWIRCGRMVIRAGGEAVEPRPPYLMLVQPNAPYQVEVLAGVKLQETYLIFSPRPIWSAWLNWPPVLKGVGCLPIDMRFDALMLEALRDAAMALQSTGPLREAFAFNALERALLLAHERNPLAKHASLDPRVRAAVDFMTGNYAEAISVDALAERVHMSPSRFAHLFREQLGEPPMKHLEHIRMTRAQQLLISTAEPIALIAQQVGFDNPYHFSTRFSKTIGQSPRDYRTKPGKK